MRLRLPLLVPLCAAPLLASLPTAEDVVLAYEEGDEVSRSFRQTLDVELVEFEIRVFVDGEEADAGDSPDVDLRIEDDESIVLDDEIVAVDDEGRPTAIRRTFEEITSVSDQELTDPSGESVEESLQGTSELSGLTVLFTWDEDAEEWAREFDGDDEGDPELLDDLEADADLTGFLPGVPVDVDDSWDVPLDTFIELSNPGGDLSIVREDDADDEGEFDAQFRENLGGSIRATLAGVDDGLATIDLEADLETWVEVDQPVPDDVDVEATQEMEFAFELEGELLWSLDGGRAWSLEWTGDVTIVVTNTKSGEQGDVELEVVQVQTFEGELVFEVSFD